MYKCVYIYYRIRKNQLSRPRCEEFGAKDLQGPEPKLHGEILQAELGTQNAKLWELMP